MTIAYMSPFIYRRSVGLEPPRHRATAAVARGETTCPEIPLNKGVDPALALGKVGRSVVQLLYPAGGQPVDPFPGAVARPLPIRLDQAVVFEPPQRLIEGTRIRVIESEGRDALEQLVPMRLALAQKQQQTWPEEVLR